jgi:hypothetical protein
MKGKEFFWRGSYKESHEKLISAYLWDYRTGRSVAGRLLTALAQGRGGIHSYDSKDYDAAIHARIDIEESTFENKLIFRDLAEEAINNPFSALPYISRFAERAGERNRAKERTFRALQERHGRITRRIYELVPSVWLEDSNDANSKIYSRETAFLSYFLTESGVCIKASRVNPKLISSFERRANAHALNPELHRKWVQSKILGAACIDPSLFVSKSGIVNIEDLLLNPKTDVFSCGLTNDDYEVICTDTRFAPMDCDHDFRISPISIKRLLAERSGYTILLIARPPLNSLI